MNTATIAYQGEPGAFGELAARRLGGASVVPLACRTFESVFDALVLGRARYAAIPYVNTLSGPVVTCCRLLAREPVRVLDSVALPIALALIAPASVALPCVRQVLSHPVALRQCRRLFARHPDWAAVEAVDTAGAVASIVTSTKGDRAAIASAWCAALYGARVLLENVQDSNENYTHFLLIAREK